MWQEKDLLLKKKKNSWWILNYFILRQYSQSKAWCTPLPYPHGDQNPYYQFCLHALPVICWLIKVVCQYHSSHWCNYILTHQCHSSCKIQLAWGLMQTVGGRGDLDQQNINCNLYLHQNHIMHIICIVLLNKKKISTHMKLRTIVTYIPVSHWNIYANN